MNGKESEESEEADDTEEQSFILGLFGLLGIVGLFVFFGLLGFLGFFVYSFLMSPRGKLVLLIGPSGVGKSVILKALKERHPEYVFPRSATTRSRREGEGDELYRFMSEEEFDQLIQKDGVLEWAAVHSGARYGTLTQEIVPSLQQGKTVVREVDVQGFDSIRTHPLFRGDQATHIFQSIFIVPESKEQLTLHITKRAPMGGQEFTHRMASMEKELTYAALCDYRITNAEGRLEQTIAEVEKAIGSST